MCNNLTIVIPNRNRKFEVVRRSLNSIGTQLSEQVKLVVVDYGSPLDYQQQLVEVVQAYPFIDLILCPTQHQLWSKSRCINMVLKNCETSHFMVCDMDMIWHPQFIAMELAALHAQQAQYYSVGIMTEATSALDQDFALYDVKFLTNEDATGITIFPTQALKNINGFDEFYHGWGAEDSDAHLRLKNSGIPVVFKNDMVYFKHQWHPKTYRSKDSDAPFHELLEPINHEYFTLSRKLNKTKANLHKSWGMPCDSSHYNALQSPTCTLTIPATHEAWTACYQTLQGLPKETVVQVTIIKHKKKTTLKTQLKKLANKKRPAFLELDVINRQCIELLIASYHNCAYTYSFDRHKERIVLTLNLQ